MKKVVSLLDLQLMLCQPSFMVALAGMVCVLGAVFFWRDAVHLEADTRHLLGQSTLLAHTPASVSDTDLWTRGNALRLSAFAKGLKTRQECPSILLQMWKQAEAAGVTVARADYSTEPEVEGGYARMVITMPLKGSYQAIKQYVFAQLANNPALALSKFQIKAEKIGDGVEAELTFTLFVAEH